MAARSATPFNPAYYRNPRLSHRYAGRARTMPEREGTTRDQNTGTFEAEHPVQDVEILIEMLMHGNIDRKARACQGTQVDRNSGSAEADRVRSRDPDLQVAGGLVMAPGTTDKPAVDPPIGSPMRRHRKPIFPRHGQRWPCANLATRREWDLSGKSVWKKGEDFTGQILEAYWGT